MFSFFKILLTVQTNSQNTQSPSKLRSCWSRSGMDSVSYNDKEINYLVFISKFVRNPFFCLYCKVALDDGFGILFFSQILFFITEMWFLSLVSMHEGVFTNDYLSEDFFGILFCDYCKVELDDGLLFYCSFF